jgi:hypothetical protein
MGDGQFGDLEVSLGSENRRGGHHLASKNIEFDAP